MAMIMGNSTDNTGHPDQVDTVLNPVSGGDYQLSPRENPTGKMKTQVTWVLTL